MKVQLSCGFFACLSIRRMVVCGLEARSLCDVMFLLIRNFFHVSVVTSSINGYQ